MTQGVVRVGKRTTRAAREGKDYGQTRGAWTVCTSTYSNEINGSQLHKRKGKLVWR